MAGNACWVGFFLGFFFFFMFINEIVFNFLFVIFFFSILATFPFKYRPVNRENCTVHLIVLSEQSYFILNLCTFD